MRRSLLVLLAGAVLGSAACGGSDTVVDTPGVVRVSATEAADIIVERAGDADFTILDVRTPEEYVAGHIAGAVNMSFFDPEFADAIAALDPGAGYVLYCRGGRYSAEVSALMRDLSFVEVYEIGGGIMEWESAGLPIVP